MKFVMSVSKTFIEDTKDVLRSDLDWNYWENQDFFTRVQGSYAIQVVPVFSEEETWSDMYHLPMTKTGDLFIYPMSREGTSSIEYYDVHGKFQGYSCSIMAGNKPNDAPENRIANQLRSITSKGLVFDDANPEFPRNILWPPLYEHRWVNRADMSSRRVKEGRDRYERDRDEHRSIHTEQPLNFMSSGHIIDSSGLYHSVILLDNGQVLDIGACNSLTTNRVNSASVDWLNTAIDPVQLQSFASDFLQYLSRAYPTKNVSYHQVPLLRRPGMPTLQYLVIYDVS